MTPWPEIARVMADATGSDITLSDWRPVSGGCINQGYVVRDPATNNRYFVKLNRAALADMFAAEADGLTELHRAGALPVPRPIAHGVASDVAFLAMEYLEFGSRSDPTHFGVALAALHRNEQRRYGWHRANTIGSTPQLNDWSDDWVEFWREHRLGFQLKLAADNGAPQRLRTRGRALLANLSALFDGYTPAPSLLHGDLWSGNCHALADGRTAIFDPAVYFGDRETDLAMTELFGGFSPAFYEAYRAAYPLHPGYTKRRILYNLYHVLNHFNLFGGGYLHQADDMIEQLLQHIG